tara:strand:- start:544 stop:675 length:132 start_codon:yes stop_codon:yes gene_type:complete
MNKHEEQEEEEDYNEDYNYYDSVAENKLNGDSDYDDVGDPSED